MIQWGFRGPCTRFISITSKTDARLSSVWPTSTMGTVTASIIQQGESHKNAFVSAAMTNPTKVFFSLKFCILKFFLPAVIFFTSTVRVQDTRKAGNTELGWHSGQKETLALVDFGIAAACAPISRAIFLVMSLSDYNIVHLENTISINNWWKSNCQNQQPPLKRSQ